MRGRLFGLAFCVLASCTATEPAFAQQCVSVERILEQLEPVKEFGALVVTFPRAEVPAVLAFLSDAGSPAPDDFHPDAVILVVGDRAGMLLFVEGDKICRNLDLPLKAAEKLMQAVCGRAV